jgi:hypothetical protein
MKFTATAVLVLLTLVGYSGAGKQKIILRLREPLKAETVKITVPELNNGRGETRDLETKVELGGQAKTEAPKSHETFLKLDMVVRSVGKNGVQVTITLPNPGYVEVVMMDFYGKNLATLFAGNLTPAVYPMRPFIMKDGDNNGIKFMTLRINGKVVMKRVITKVR